MDALRPRLHSLAGSLISHRLLLYTLSSTVAVSAVIANALRIHSNFYSITVYLSKSGHSVLVRHSIAACARSQLTKPMTGPCELLYPHFLSMWEDITASVLWVFEASRSRGM